MPTEPHLVAAKSLTGYAVKGVAPNQSALEHAG
jgi:hypothetical protein